MAEIHIIGQIKSAKDFPKQGLFCKWNLQYGKLPIIDSFGI